MASCFFLLKQFEDVLIYFNSIKSYFYNDDSFNFNYAQSKAANGNFKEAEEVCLFKIPSLCFVKSFIPLTLYTFDDSPNKLFLQTLLFDCFIPTNFKIYTMSYVFHDSIICLKYSSRYFFWFKTRKSRMIMFTSVGLHDAVSYSILFCWINLPILPAC